MALLFTCAAPRVVRPGDDFLAGVTATAHESAVEVTVTVYHVCELLTVMDTVTMTKTISPQTGPLKFDFHFRAYGTGTANLIFKAEVSGNIYDALLISQHVAGTQEPVYIATSMAVSYQTPSTEGFRLPPSEPFSGTLDVQAGVGRLPAIMQIGTVVVRDAEGPYQNAYNLLASLVSSFFYEIHACACF